MNQAEIYSSHQYTCRKLSMVAALYALLALWNVLIYSPTRFEVLGFTDDPIGWWVLFTTPVMITFCVLTIRLLQQGRRPGAPGLAQRRTFKRRKRMLVLLVALFTFPNTLIAFMHFGAIQMRYSYWGQVRPAYEVPIFHLLPMLLFLYWWLSSREWRWGE